MTEIVIIYEDKALSFQSDNGDGWLTQKQIAELFDVTVPTINEHIKNILDDEELDDSTIRKFRIVADDGKKRKIKHYNLHMIIAIGYRVNSKKGTKFRVWATDTLHTYLTQGVTVNPTLASADPELVQDNFHAQLSPYMKRKLNQHAHTSEYRKERLDNVEARKKLSSELVRTIDGNIQFGKIMGMFHISLTGKTKSQLLAEYEHATKTTSAIDTLGSIVVNQINLLMTSVRLTLEKYPPDYIPDDVHTAQLERIVNRYAQNIRAHLEILAQETGQPLEQLGENSYKKRLM